MPKSQILNASVTDSTLTTTKLATPNLGKRNLVINGAMQVAQRSTSFTSVAGSAYHLDRYRTGMGDTSARFTVTQATAGLNGFPNSLKYDCTTAESSLSNADARLFVTQRIEGQDLQQLKKGTSDAEKFTLSFYVKGNASATYSVEVYDSDNNRSIGQTFSVTTSWNRVVLTFDADTSGALNDDNGIGFYVNWWLHAGSDYTGGTFNTTWQDYVNNQRAGNTTSFLDSTDRTFFMTGVQLEVGSQATPFEHRSFGEEQQLCRRYYNEYSGGTNAHRLYSYNYNASYKGYFFYFPVKMRAAPTATLSGNGSTGTAGILNENYMFRYISGGVDVNTTYYLYDFSFDAEL